MNKLKSDIYVVVFLAVLVVFQHISHLLGFTTIWFVLPYSIIVLVFTILYFIQLTNNLKQFLSIENIRVQTYSIIACYVFIYLITNLVLSDNRTFSHSNFKYKDVIIAVVLIFFLLISIFLIVQYCILGFKLIKKDTNSHIKKLGISFSILIPIAIISMLVLTGSKTLKNYSHLFTIIEISPYWFTYKLYKEILPTTEFTPIETI